MSEVPKQPSDSANDASQQTERGLGFTQLDNPHRRPRPDTPWYNHMVARIGVPLAAAALGVGVGAAASGGGSAEAAATHPVATASPNGTASPNASSDNGQQGNVATEATPAELAQRFLALAVVDGSKAAADESYQYFSDKGQAAMSLEQWEHNVAKAAPVLSGSAPLLRGYSETDLIAARVSHDPVDPIYFDQAADGNYVIGLELSYDASRAGWRVDAYGSVPTQQTE